MAEFSNLFAAGLISQVFIQYVLASIRLPGTLLALAASTFGEIP